MTTIIRLFITIFFISSGWSFAQTTFQEQAARLQNINAYLLDLRPGTPPLLDERSFFEFVLDATPQPSIDTRVGRKDEPIDPPSFVPRLRGRYVHKSGITFGAAYAPGIEFQDYEAEYVSFELGYRFRLEKFHLSVRAGLSDGDVKGPITETGVEDLFDFENRTLDLSLGYPLGRFHFYGFLGGIQTDTKLEVATDGVRLSNDEETYYGGLGVHYELGRKLSVNLEQNATDDYLQHLIVSLTYRL